MKRNIWLAILVLLPVVALAKPAQRGEEIVYFSAPPAGFEIGYRASQGAGKRLSLRFLANDLRTQPAKRQARIYLDKSDAGRTCALCGAIRFPPLTEPGGTNRCGPPPARYVAVRYAAGQGAAASLRPALGMWGGYLKAYCIRFQVAFSAECCCILADREQFALQSGIAVGC